MLTRVWVLALWALAATVVVASAAVLGRPAAAVGAVFIVASAFVLWRSMRRSAADQATLDAGVRSARAQVELAETESDRLRSALALAADGVVILAPERRVVFANPTARLMLQDRILEVAHRLDHPELDRVVEHAAESGRAVVEDVVLRVPGARPARARAVPLGDGTIVLLLSDLSETYRLDRVRRDFVANVSHELKTPVASIRALAETAATAQSGDDLETSTRFVERLVDEATRLAELVSDLLDLSRVEAGAGLEKTRVDLDGLLLEAADRGRVIAESKGIDIEVKRAGLQVDADPSQLSMAVKNLVDNAVRYSERGTVSLSAEASPAGVEIRVSDEGIGIPSDELERIFERFYRVDKARSRATGGTGLGLAIVRHVIDNHGGAIEVQSQIGSGTTFTITLPGEGPKGIR